MLFRGLLAFCFIILTGCQLASNIGPDGQPMRRIYYINSYDAGKIQFNTLDLMDPLR